MLSVSSCSTARVTSPRLLLIVYSLLNRSEVMATTSIFFSPTHSSPFFSKYKEEQREAKAEGWDMWLESESAVVEVLVVGSGIRKKIWKGSAAIRQH